MAPTILLVDDQRDILRLLHSTLDTLKVPELEIIEAPSGEEALLEIGRRKIDLLVTDYLLPGITGIELMHKMRVRVAGRPGHPDHRHDRPQGPRGNAERRRGRHL